MQSNRATGDMTGTNNGPMGVSHLPGGTFIDFDPPGLGTYVFMAVLVDTGPPPAGASTGGASDYSDARYFLREVTITQASGSSPASLPTIKIVTGGFWGVAVNVAEIGPQTHSLPVYDATATGDITGASTIVAVEMIEGSSPGVGNVLFVFAVGGVGFFPVRVKQNGGADGTDSTYATWAYDVYSLKDESLVTKLNLSGAIQPEASAARVTYGSVTQATNASVAIAYRGVTGIIHLWNLQEKAVSSTCDGDATSGVTQTFANDAARTAATPDFTGQLAFQNDTTTLYYATGTSAGNWA